MGKNKNKMIAIVLVALIFLASCAKEETVIPYGDVDDISSGGLDSVSKQQDVLPPNDFNIEKSKVVDMNNAKLFENEGSYYARQLPTISEKLMYNNLRLSMEDYEDSFVVIDSKDSVSPAQLLKIMNILYFDTPELFHMDYSYAYTTDINGNVQEVFFQYIYSKDEYIEKKTSLEDDAADFIAKNRDAEEYAVIENVYNSTVRKNIVTPSKQNGEVAGIYTSSIVSRDLDSVGYSKHFSYFCKLVGVDSMVVIGELTSGSFETDNDIVLTCNSDKIVYENNFPPFSLFAKPNPADKEEKDKDNEKESKTESSSAETEDSSNEDVQSSGKDDVNAKLDGATIVTLPDITNSYAWNLVKINDSWYNIDVTYDSLYSKKLLKEGIIQDISDFKALNCVDDYTISSSRISYKSENTLGIVPQANKKSFQYFYREGKFVPKYNANQVSIYASQRISSIVTGKTKYFVLQFEDDETYSLFLNDWEKQVDKYNEENMDIIRSYKLKEIDSSLVVIVYDILYNI